MPTTYKVLGQENPSATTLTSLYTVPASTSTVVSTVTIANLANSSGTFRVAVRPAGASIVNKHYIAYDAPLGINDMASMSMGLTLTATDVITVFANTSTVSFGIFGSEIN